MTEEAYIHLDKKLFELFLTLSQCLSSVEEMLEMPRLYREDGSGQQVHCEVGHFSQTHVFGHYSSPVS